MSLDDGRRFFVVFTTPRIQGQGAGSFGALWRLCELGAELREVDRGSGTLTLVPDGSHILEQPRPDRGGPNLRERPSHEYVVLRDAKTGRVVRRIEIAGRNVHFYEFDPSRQTYLVESCPANNRRRTPELAVTGTALAGVRLIPHHPTPRPSHQFSRFASTCSTRRRARALVSECRPDRFQGGLARPLQPGRARILFRYEESTGVVSGARPPPSRGRTASATRRDGTLEHDLVVRDLPRGERALEFVANGKLPALAFSPDVRHVAVPDFGEVQVWDLTTGTLRHRLSGHTGTASADIAALYNADGSRLVTRDDLNLGRPSRGTSSRAQLLVWDTTTGRELLSFGLDDTVPLRVEFAGEKLLLRSPLGVRVLDGTPVKP